MTSDKSEIIIYQTEDGHTKIDVHIEKETVWLTQTQMSELFQTTKQNISPHINNAFKEGEIDHISVVKEYLTTASMEKVIVQSITIWMLLFRLLSCKVALWYAVRRWALGF